jgi:hypothetical protein
MFKLLAVVKHSDEQFIMSLYMVTQLIYNSARVYTKFKKLAVVKHSEELVKNAKLYR